MEYQKLKDLKKEGDAVVAKLRGGFGSFGGNNDNKFNLTKGRVEKFVGNVNAYIEDNPDVKSKMRNLIKKIEKEINNLKSSNILTSNIIYLTLIIPKLALCHFHSLCVNNYNFIIYSQFLIILLFFYFTYYVIIY